MVAFFAHLLHTLKVNALANSCFLTKDTNLKISDRLPEEYFAEVEANHPGSLASQWIPQDQAHWKAGNYRGFLAARRELLAAETNRRMAELPHGDTCWLEGAPTPVPGPMTISSGITSEDEEELLGTGGQLALRRRERHQRRRQRRQQPHRHIEWRRNVLG